MNEVRPGALLAHPNLGGPGTAGPDEELTEEALLTEAARNERPWRASPFNALQPDRATRTALRPRRAPVPAALRVTRTRLRRRLVTLFVDSGRTESANGGPPRRRT